MTELTVEITPAVWADADAGAVCRYVRLFGGGLLGGRPCGVKIYRGKRQADRARARQHRAWALGLAPMAGPRVRARVLGQKTVRFGYLTEHAFDVNGPAAEVRAGNVMARCRAAGVPTRDCEPWNVGRLRDDRWVRIDFDDHSV